MSQSIEASALFEQAIAWLRQQYADYRFFTERDVVWTVQRWLAQQIDRQGLPLRVFNDYPLLPGQRRSLCTDLALVPVPSELPKQSPSGKWGASGPVAVAVEFKYEPSHARSDIWPTKLPVVEWGDVVHDIARLNEFLSQGRATVAYALLIDESGSFRHRTPILPGEWQDWEHGVAIHWTRQVSVLIPSETRDALSS